MIMDILFPLFFIGFVGFFVYSVFTKKGRGRFFGGKILKTIDTEIKSRKGMMNSTIRVHVIEKKKQIENAVSIELNQHAYLAWSMMPINLSKDDAKTLISMLEEAVMA